MTDIDLFSMRKYKAERRTRTVDFASKIASGVTISSAAVACLDADTDVDESSMLASTTGTISGTTVSFAVLGGVVGREYNITVTATLSNSDILVAKIRLAVV